MMNHLGEKRRAELGILACGILRDELEAVLRARALHLPVFYLGATPCMDYVTFPLRLRSALERARTQCQRLLVVIGRCHPEVDEIIAALPAQRLPIDNCFDALLGGCAREIARERRAFFTTPTWLKHWRRALEKGLHWQEVDARQNLGHNQRILLLDAGVTPFSDEEILDLFDYTQLPVETLPVDLEEFARLLLGPGGVASLSPSVEIPLA